MAHEPGHSNHGRPPSQYLSSQDGPQAWLADAIERAVDIRDRLAEAGDSLAHEAVFLVAALNGLQESLPEVDRPAGNG